MKSFALLAVLAACAFATSSSSAEPPKRPAVPTTSTPNHAVINGTGMGRPGSGPGTVGGVGKNAGTSINGTMLRPRH